MVGQVVEHHGVARVDGVGSGEQLHAVLDGVGLFVVELEDGETNQGSHALWVELQGTAEGQTSFVQLV